jgi:hypothetical protein
LFDEKILSTRKYGDCFKSIESEEPKMDNKVLNDIIDYATKRLNAEYGYCGVAKGDKMAMLNSDDRKGSDIIIKIELKPSE